MIVCPSVDVNAAIHCQIDDDYLTLKNDKLTETERDRD